MKGSRQYAVVFMMISVPLLFSCMGNSGKNKSSGDGSAVSEKSIRIDGHRFVDLGLPSGLLWAETNVGATSEADAGEYFSWGETKEKADYAWTSYAFGNGEDNLTKYKNATGKDVLDFSDDAAYVNWGKSCRMPTQAEFVELRDSSNCIWNWTSRTVLGDSTVYGYQVTSKSNGNSIFFPAVGCRDGEKVIYYGSRGYYWSSTLNALYDFYACYLCLESDCIYNGHDSRYYGLPVRPVAVK